MAGSDECLFVPLSVFIQAKALLLPSLPPLPPLQLLLPLIQAVLPLLLPSPSKARKVLGEVGVAMEETVIGTVVETLNLHLGWSLTLPNHCSPWSYLD